jgi:hypothetical protein
LFEANKLDVLANSRVVTSLLTGEQYSTIYDNYVSDIGNIDKSRLIYNFYLLINKLQQEHIAFFDYLVTQMPDNEAEIILTKLMLLADGKKLDEIKELIDYYYTKFPVCKDILLIELDYLSHNFSDNLDKIQTLLKKIDALSLEETNA